MRARVPLDTFAGPAVRTARWDCPSSCLGPDDAPADNRVAAAPDGYRRRRTQPGRAGITPCSIPCHPLDRKRRFGIRLTHRRRNNEAGANPLHPRDRGSSVRRKRRVPAPWPAARVELAVRIPRADPVGHRGLGSLASVYWACPEKSAPAASSCCANVSNPLLARPVRRAVFGPRRIVRRAPDIAVMRCQPHSFSRSQPRSGERNPELPAPVPREAHQLGLGALGR